MTYKYLPRYSLLLLLSVFFIFTPVLDTSFKNKKPEVKAAFSSEPKLPVSQKISPPVVTAMAVFIMDLDSGTVLYSKSPHLRLKPASLTKIMTALVSLDYFQEDAVLRVKTGQSSLGNTAKLVKGDELTAIDVLYALLVPSGNDAAVTLAENYPGGYRAFVTKMNQKALALGLQNTNFVNVSGVESPNHYTSAFDIAMIARESLRRPIFSSMVSTQQVTIKSLLGHLYPLTSTNILLGKLGILGVKTGWTPEAGECLVIKAEQGGHPILISLLGSKDRFGEAEKLVRWTYSNFSWE